MGSDARNSALGLPGGSVRSGFTLVEILTVIVIIGILAAITVPAVTSALRAARTAAIRTEISVLSQALEAYKMEYGEYPPDFYSWPHVERHFRKAFPDIDDNELRILAQFTHYRVNGPALARGGKIDPRDHSVPPRYDHYPHAIDRAEALVFCLGGFSSDKRRPFTGEGGPLALTPGNPNATPPIPEGRFISDPSVAFDRSNPTGQDYQAFQYNTDRETGFFDFETNQLSLNQYEQANPIFTYSNDELEELPNPNAINALVAANDLVIEYYPDPFPTYRPKSSNQPIVYFAASSYEQAWGDATGLPPVWYGGRESHSQNLYLPNGDIEETGVARPYATTDIKTTTPPQLISGINLPTGHPQLLQFAENNRFQLISAGLDGCYGGVVGSDIDDIGADAGAISVFPSGGYYNPFITTPLTTTKYQDDLQLANQIYNAQPQLDNVTNFSTSDLESDLP